VLTIIDFDREVRYSLQQLCNITTLESDAKRMDKGVEVVILGTTSLRSLVLGWAVGIRSKASRHGALFFPGVDPPQSGYVLFPLLVDYRLT
jgi:hypothetical protein